MIINEEIEIVVNSMDFRRLGDKYHNLHVGDVIKIFVHELSHSSKRKIDVKCDICGKEKKLSYEKYLKNIKNCDFYACTSKCADEKVKRTSIINFGVANASNSIEKQKKRLETFRKKFGVDNPFQNKEIKEKSKDTCIGKYGVDNIFKSTQFKNYIKRYNFEHYGVEYISQVPEIYMRQQKSGYRIHFHENTKLNYRGTYEKHFLDYCFDNNISIEQGKRIKYRYEEGEHYYFSDYYIKSKNLIVEIKSTWTYNKYLSKNLVKKNATIGYGYNYMIIKDKNYEEFKEYLNKN